MRLYQCVGLVLLLFATCIHMSVPIAAVRTRKGTDDGIGARLETKTVSTLKGKRGMKAKKQPVTKKNIAGQKVAIKPPKCLELAKSKDKDSKQDMLAATVQWYQTETVGVFDVIQGAKTWREKAKFAMKLRRRIRRDTVKCLKALGYRSTLEVYLVQYSLTTIFKNSKDFKGPSFESLVSKYANRNFMRAPTHQYLDRAYKDIVGNKEAAKSMFHPWLCARSKRHCVLQISHMEQV